MRNLRFISALLLIGTLGSSLSSSAAARADCKAQLQHLAPLGYLPKSLTVPEDWSVPSGKKIRVTYYLRQDFENRNTVIFFNGGPAAAAGSSIPILNTLSTKHPINFVVFDQRGTGCSDAYPDAPSKIPLYASSAIVNDAEALRKMLLGEQKWKIFGQSYGGLIVQRYLEDHPEGVSHAYAHAYSQLNDSTDWMVERLRAQSHLAEVRIGAVPGLKMKVQNFSPRACVQHGEFKVCGQSVIDSLFLLLGFHDENFLGVLLNIVDQKELAPDMQNYLYEYFFKSGLSNVVSGNILAIHDMLSFSDAKICALAQASPKYRQYHLDQALVNECRLTLGLTQKQNEAQFHAYKFDPLNYDKIRTNIVNYHIPYFLYSGDQDGFVPPATFTDQLTALEGVVRYTEFKNSGHEGFMTEMKIIADLNLDSDYISDAD
jgi:pimeloyl-ACP methyl ester carboxylesterase